jgi:hypothetical protein
MVSTVQPRSVARDRCSLAQTAANKANQAIGTNQMSRRGLATTG